MPKMRAKMQIRSVKIFESSEKLKLECVSRVIFGSHGENEDNTFACYTPSGSMELTVTNPDLLGKFKPGQKFYLDFTESES